MQHKISRRTMVKSGLIAGALFPTIGLIANTAEGAALTPLDASDPTAKALGFVADASKVSASDNPTFKAGQKCGTCAQYQGKAADATGGCNIFVGHSVPVGGWCKVWAQKPGA
jgi:High potential iron-sulfur protein